MKARHLLIPFTLGLGLVLATLWLLGGGLPTTHAQGPDGYSTYYVGPSCAGIPDPCYTTVQAAVDAADDPGDVVKVAAGTYTDVHLRPRNDITTTGFVTQVVYISKTVTIRGGYTLAFTDPPDPEANPTTLDAQGQGRVLFVAAGSSVIIGGMNIINGRTPPGEEGRLGPIAAGDGDPGAGVYNAGVLTLTSSIISSNTTGGGGWSVWGGWGGTGGAGKQAATGCSRGLVVLGPTLSSGK